MTNTEYTTGQTTEQMDAVSSRAVIPRKMNPAGKVTDRDLKRLSREELLELLIASEKRGQALQAELETQKQNTAELEEQLRQRKYDMTEAGDLANAALKINGVFEAAQQAAADYLENIRSLSSRQNAICAEREAKSQEEAHRMLKETTRKCEAMQKEAEERCWNLEEETKASCDKAKEEARTEVEQYWSSLSDRLEEFYKAHEGMREILSFYNMKLPQVGPKN